MTRRDDATPASPTADQITISGGGTEAVIVTLGAALRTLTQDGSPLVDGFTADEPVPYGRGQLCIPWPNRIRKGVYTWDGVEIQAADQRAGPQRGAARTRPLGDLGRARPDRPTASPWATGSARRTATRSSSTSRSCTRSAPPG